MFINYCYRKIWICLSFGTLLIACCTMLILFFYDYQRRSKKIEFLTKQKKTLHSNVSDEQIRELLRLTPSVHVEQKNFNRFNRLTFS